jgi:hypothetical protein
VDESAKSVAVTVNAVVDELAAVEVMAFSGGSETISLVRNGYPKGSEVIARCSDNGVKLIGSSSHFRGDIQSTQDAFHQNNTHWKELSCEDEE